MKLKYLILILIPLSVFAQSKTVIPGQVYMPGISGTGNVGVVASDGKITKGSVSASDLTNFKEQCQDSVGAMVNSTLTYNDATPSLGINLGNANTWTADISVPDEAYDPTAWNGSVEVPTKNSVRDKIELLVTSIGSAVTSVSGTSNRITSTGGTTPVIDISASYVGQSSITTLGTITTGVWNGTAIANANLANSTISGISLGSTLANLSATDGTLTFSGTYTGATARTIGLNLSNANTWAADQSVPDEVYDATNWNGSLEVPTKNAIRDKIESLSSGGLTFQQALAISTLNL